MAVSCWRSRARPANLLAPLRYFADLTKWQRVLDYSLPWNSLTSGSAILMGTSVTNNTLGDPTFSYSSDAYLRVSAAMQPTSLSKPNWQSMRPLTATFKYNVTPPCPPPGSSFPPPRPRPLPPPPPARPPPPGATSPEPPASADKEDMFFSLLISTCVMGGSSLIVAVGAFWLARRVRSGSLSGGLPGGSELTPRAQSAVNPFSR